MKILNIEQFNEKLNIQPISKKRLKGTFFKTYRTEEELKKNLQMGDIVKFEDMDDDIYVYVSQKDIESRLYDRVLGIKLQSEGNGLFVICTDTTQPMFAMFAYFSIDIIQNVFVSEAYRLPNLKLPIDIEYFMYPPIDKGVLIYKQN